MKKLAIAGVAELAAIASPASWGSGHIHDADPSLGGPFKLYWTNPRVGPAQDGSVGRAYGQWNVDLESC